VLALGPDQLQIGVGFAVVDEGDLGEAGLGAARPGDLAFRIDRKAQLLRLVVAAAAAGGECGGGEYGRYADDRSMPESSASQKGPP
jgi:hypothetical protein